MRRAGVPALLIACHLALGLWAVMTHSATFDEPNHVATGFSYWKGDFRMNQDFKNPPLGALWVSWPLLLQKVAFPDATREWAEGVADAFGERLLFWNGNDSEALLRSARLANLGLSCLLGLLLWRRVRARFGAGPAALALAFYAFSPSILGHATLATSDFPFVFCAMLAVFALCDLLSAPSRASAARMTAWALGAFACKHAGIMLWPAAAAAGLLAVPERGRRTPALLHLAASFASWLGLIGLAFCGFPELNDAFFRVIKDVGNVSHPRFALGVHSDRGLPWFYALVFASKSTIAELILAGAALALATGKRLRLDPELAVPMAVGGVFLAAGSISQKQFGLRYVLAVYPMLALAAAPWAAALAQRRAWIVWALGLGHALSALAAAPHHLAYFNEAAGGARNGYRILVDSSLDWGQDLKRLASHIRREAGTELILCYFGTASPETYGLRPQQLHSTNRI